MADPDIPIAYGVPVGVPTTSFPPPVRPSVVPVEQASSSSFRVQQQQQQQHEEDEPLSPNCVRELQEQGYTHGLTQALWKKRRSFPLNIWVVDNSGSMAHPDGHKLIRNLKNDSYQTIPCTRWTEMQQTIQYHAQLAALLQCPTVFRLLNDPGRVVGPQQLSIAQRGSAFLDEDLAVATSTIQNASPGGVTPLVGHLRDIWETVKSLEPSLRRNGTKVAIVLATDGIPTDERGYSNDDVQREFARALRAFEGLPVWIVVRLCTDEQAIVEYWNQLDSDLELSLEVLDDFISEAEEIYQHNKWLNYGLPLHRLREMGYHDRVFDLLDERKLAKDELREFCRVLFGDDATHEIPEPEVDWDGFVANVTALMAKETNQWNPRTKRLEPWINMKQLKRDYGPGWFSW